MPIPITCPACKRSLRVPDHLVGQQVKCPACLTQFAAIEDRTGAPKPSYRTEPEESPPARSGPRPYSDYADDPNEWDDDFIPGRRRADPENALAKLAVPAYGLLATGIIGILVGLLFVALGLLLLDNRQDPEDEGNGITMLVSAPFQIIFSLVVLLGAISMLRLKRHGLALTGSVFAFVPCTTPCCLLGLPFGIWGMIVLNNPEVKRAFS